LKEDKMKSILISIILIILAQVFVNSKIYSQIIINGDFGDWSGISAYETDSNADNGGGDYDLTAGYYTHANDTLFLRIDVKGTFNPQGWSYYYIVYIDTDRSTSTGFTSGWWTMGADYRIVIFDSTQYLQYHIGSDTSDTWGWNGNQDSALTISAAWNGSSCEAKVAFSDLNVTSSNTIWLQWRADSLDVNTNALEFDGMPEFYSNSRTNVPLPVQLSSFTASTKGRDVILNWTTATEVNTAGFEIERKLVSQEKAQAKWENVGFVRGNGNSNRPVEYTFTDMKLNTGKYAYRLKMVDNDGSYEYSNEVVVEIGKPDVTKIEQNYPNAFNPATKIEYELANPSKVVIEVYNITGQKITELVNDEQVEGYYSLVFDASKYGLASGIYFYRMIAMDKVTSKNVVMTKKMLYLK
jgi:hypothetical protein